MYMYIRHRAARHARACLIHLSGCLIILASDSLKGPQAREPFSLQPSFCYFLPKQSLPLRVPGGFSSDSMGGFLGEGRPGALAQTV